MLLWQVDARHQHDTLERFRDPSAAGLRVLVSTPLLAEGIDVRRCC